MFSYKDIQSTPLQVIDAQSELGFSTTPVTKLMDAYTVSKLDRSSEQKLSVEELKQFHPDMEWKEPVSLPAANFLVGLEKENRKNRETIDKGVDGFFNNIPGFIANMAEQVKDPVNLAAGFATSGLSKFYQAGKALSLGARVAVGATEAVVQGAVSEGIILGSNKVLQQEYTPEQLIMNIVAGTVMQVGISHGVEIGNSVFGKFSPKVNASILEHYGQALDNSVVTDLNTIVNRGAENLTLDDNIASAVRSHFGEEYLNDVDTVQDLKEKLFSDENVSLQKQNDFYNEVRNSGSLNKFVDKDSVINLSPEERQNIKNKFSDYKSQAGYDAVSIKHVDEKIADIGKYNSEVRKDLDEKIDFYRKQISAGDIKDPEIMKTKEFIDLLDEEIAHEEFIPLYAKCLGGI